MPQPIIEDIIIPITSSGLDADTRQWGDGGGGPGDVTHLGEAVTHDAEQVTYAGAVL